MNTNTYKIVVDKSPRGYACIELVFNGQGEAIDYIIIDINPSFARLTKKGKIGFNQSFIIRGFSYKQ